jgi:hypothetical protein
MSPGVLGALIPVVAVGGLFAWLIARTLSKAYTERLRLRAGGPERDDVLAAVDELRREVAELAERVDFTERLLAKGSDTARRSPP